MKIDRFDFDELQQFKAAQATAYDVVRVVAREMTAGMSERQVAERIGAELEARGIRDMFHQPFAWFGDRTAFRNFGPDTDFLPTERRLEKGMSVILDVAPIRDGYACDIGYTTSFGRNADVEAMQKVLMECRDFILAGARARKPFRQIYRELDGLIARHGFVNVHRIYPERVLAHRVFRFGGSRAQQFLQRFRVLGFGLPTYAWLLGRAALSRLVPGLQSPLWNDGPECAHAPLPGVWAVEPHIATPDYRAGAKWEEMLVITDTDAYWLDDDVPHCQQARRRGWWPGSVVNARNNTVAEAA